MDFGQCQPACSRLIASEDQHTVSASDVWAWPMHETLFLAIRTANTVWILHWKSLRARLAVFDRESAVLPRCAAPEASFLREAAAWSSEAELEAWPFHFLRVKHSRNTAKTQSAAFKQFMPRHAHEPASASSCRECPAPKCTALYWKRGCYHHSVPLVVVHFSNMSMILNTHLRPLLDFWRRTGWKWFSGQVFLLIWTQSNTYGVFWRDKLSITLHPASNL